MTSASIAVPASERTSFASNTALWAAFGCILLVIPLVFRSSLALTMASQMGYLVIICLSYNILFGQGGMLSFGHAVYSGLGAFATIHAMNLASRGEVWLPLWLMPVVGGLAGLAAASLLGWVTTRRAGTTFAMITLGVGELIASMALMFPSFFGGESGVSGDRVYGTPWFGVSFGSQFQVYYLIAGYCFICTAAMFALTRTPLGRMLNAVRENAERVAFIGYNTARIRYLGFVIAGFFAGVGGALAAISLEIVNSADSLSAARSGTYLLFTFIGGAAFFFGPIIGAVLLVFASVLLSEITKAWQLYFGLAFILTVIYAPGGIAGLMVHLARVIKLGQGKRLAQAVAPLAAAAVPMLAGVFGLVEMIYHKQFNASAGASLSMAGITLDVSSRADWAAAVATLLVGTALIGFAYRHYKRIWVEAA